MPVIKARPAIDGECFTLTDRQYKVFCYIFNVTMDTGCQPTYREIANRFGFSSPNAVANHVKAIAKKGWIKIRPERNGVQFLFTPSRCPFAGFTPIPTMPVQQ